MDGARFDQLALRFGAARSRRAALRLLAAGLLGPAALARAPRPAAAAICPQRVPKPGFTPTANGCGPDGWDWVVPDNWKKADFTRACKGHDVCYGTCNSKQARCDDAFLDGMVAACKRAYDGDGRRERRLRGDCLDRTYQYYTAVSENGQAAWEDAQDEACLCCNQDGRGPKCGTKCCPLGETCVDGRCQRPCVDGRCEAVTDRCVEGACVHFCSLNTHNTEPCGSGTQTFCCDPAKGCCGDRCCSI